MRFAYLGAVGSNTRPDLRAMMLLAAALNRSAGASARGATLALSALTVARRGGRLFQSLAKRSAPRPQRGHTTGRGGDVIVHGGAFKAWACRARNRVQRTPSFHFLAWPV